MKNKSMKKETKFKVGDKVYVNNRNNGMVIGEGITILPNKTWYPVFLDCGRTSEYTSTALKKISNIRYCFFHLLRNKN